jgi:16S rRNA (cytosine967-C5)-methyltransferase
MAASPARSAALEILLRVDRDQAYASELLHSSQYEKLSWNDHRLTTELVMGVLRWRSVLDGQISRASSQQLNRLDAEVLCALRLGVYQLKLLSRIPARAAIFESVELVKAARKRSAATFVNAVLRKVADLSSQTATSKASSDPFSAIRKSTTVESLAAESAHPLWMVARWEQRYGLDSARKICEHDQSVPEGAIIGDDTSYGEIAAAGVRMSPGLMLRSARRVESGDVTKTNAFREGRVSIQDEASQLVAGLVGRGERILDCCAAPGGKTNLIARRNEGATVIGVDVHPHRARLMRALVKQPNVKIVIADARNLPFAGEFDRVLADVPCSGMGTLARNPEIKWRLRPEDLRDLQTRQIEILKSALARVAQGGRAVYSTCSLEPEENEEVVRAAVGSGFRILECRDELAELKRSGELAWGDVESLVSGPYLRTIPGVHPCDGFFATVIERR